MSDEKVIEVADLVQMSGREKVFDGLSFELLAGECLGVFGLRGSGKTALLHIVAGVERFKSGKITFNELLAQKFILREKGSATLQIFENYLNKKSVRLSDLNIIIQAEDNEIIKKFILSNMGIAVLPKRSVESEIEEGKMFILKLDGMSLKRKLYYVYQQDRYFSKIEDKFKEFMLEKHKLN